MPSQLRHEDNSTDALFHGHRVLIRALKNSDSANIAKMLQVDERQVDLWAKKKESAPNFLATSIPRLLRPRDTASDFTFADLFAGIGGIRLGFEKAGGGCVFTSEWDKYARQTYAANFPCRPDHVFAGDITKVKEDDIPDHDLLLAGFPCQPFSIAGVSKKNSLGRRHGFKDKTQGTLFFDVARIIAAKRPRAFLLENVKNLLRHDKGRTFEVIHTVLEDELGYNLAFQVIDARPWVPQGRQRLVIVGLDSMYFGPTTCFDFDTVRTPRRSPTMSKVLHPEDGSEKIEVPYTFGPLAEVDDRYVLSSHLWRYLKDYAKKHQDAGNGFGFGLVGPDDVARTLSARYYKDGSEILVSRGPRHNPRRLTPRECARLMGFPDSFVIPVSDTQAYRQFGNSVVVPKMTAIATALSPLLMGIQSSRKRPTKDKGR
jgi:DNA (cytosine-5)-methyltransferase 1